MIRLITNNKNRFSKISSLSHTPDREGPDVFSPIMSQPNGNPPPPTADPNGQPHSASPFATSAGSDDPSASSTERRRSYSHPHRQRLRRNHREGAGCCGQFLSTFIKTFHQKRRDTVGCLLELLLPIVFVLGLLVLWKVMGDSVEPAKHYVDWASPGSLADNTSAAAFRSSLCYNASTGPAIDGIANCSTLPSSTTIRCWTAYDRMVPVQNLCYTTINPFAFVLGAADAARYSMVGPLPMDDMITLQWATRHTIKSTRDFNTIRTAMSTCGKLYFSPDNADTAAFVAHLNTTSKLFKYVYGGTYSAEDASTKITSAEGTTWALVDLQSFTATSYHVNLRLNRTAMPETTRTA
jgi:hypothetical protein